MLSIVIPALNAEASLPRCLKALAERRGFIGEVIVVDGGSTDATQAVARAGGASVLEAPRGRGIQMAAGARAARGDWMLFLHADTVLAPGWADAVRRFMAADDAEGRAAVFRFALDDAAPAARRLERLVAWRSRVLGLPYGDQGFLISAALYQALGGFRPYPLMEDVDMVRRLGRKRLRILDAPAVTSAARYRKEGYLLRPLRNLLLLGLFFLGVPPRWLVHLYG